MQTNFAKFWATVGLMVGAMFLFGSIETNGLFSDATAAWVQALGSIAAVIGAAWIASHGTAEQRRREADERLDRANLSKLSEGRDRRRAAALARSLAHEIRGLIESIKARDDKEMSEFYLKGINSAAVIVSKFDHSRLVPDSAIFNYSKIIQVAEATCLHMNATNKDILAMDKSKRAKRYEGFLSSLEIGCEKLDELCEALEAVPSP